ncbi:UNVERIFIED_CONTAM: hypothetical protein Slati_3175700 [Sesamum latifolium]|uniref:Uncharacterized protein n=1 Tax=Sesamum latifolium TaxID=2727402 RepID=A0AAW2UXQ6_9LAMI
MIVQLHLDSSFGGFTVSTLVGDLTTRGVDFSSVSATTGGGFVSDSCLCRAFWDLEFRFPRVLERMSLLSGLDLPANVIVGRKTSTGGFSLSIAIFAASYARLWTMELQKRIASVASSRVRLLDFVPPTSSNMMVDSSEG